MFKIITQILHIEYVLKSQRARWFLYLIYFNHFINLYRPKIKIVTFLRQFKPIFKYTVAKCATTWNARKIYVEEVLRLTTIGCCSIRGSSLQPRWCTRGTRWSWQWASHRRFISRETPTTTMIRHGTEVVRPRGISWLMLDFACSRACLYSRAY